MDVVVLAAGSNQRLRGIVAPYMKPLLVVNGKCLVVNAVQLALEVVGEGDTVIVVAAPQNALPITEVLNDACPGGGWNVVIQPHAGGPGEGFLRAAGMVHSREVMILLGDNMLSAHDVLNVAQHEDESPLRIGYRRVVEGGELFTRITKEGDIIEGVPGGLWGDGRYRIWVGPLVVPTLETIKLLIGKAAELKEAVGFGFSTTKTPELKIGKYLGELGLKPFLVPVSSEDVGTPDWLMGQQWVRKEAIEAEPYDHAAAVGKIFQDQIQGVSKT